MRLPLLAFVSGLALAGGLLGLGTESLATSARGKLTEFSSVLPSFAAQEMDTPLEADANAGRAL